MMQDPSSQPTPDLHSALHSTIPSSPIQSRCPDESTDKGTPIRVATTSALSPSTPPPMFLVPTQVHLCVLDAANNDNLMVVAAGTVYPDTSGVIHGCRIPKGHYRVTVHDLVPNHVGVHLPVPHPDGEANTVGEAVHQFVAWPNESIVFIKDPQGPSSGKGSTVLSTNALDLVADYIPEVGLGDHYTVIRAIVVAGVEGKTMRMRPPVGYLVEDLLVCIEATDVRKFLKWETIKISIIEVYIMSLVENYQEVCYNSRIGFLCPGKISSSQIASDLDGVTQYLIHTFLAEKNKESPCRFILAPYNEWYHWLLFLH